MAEVRSGLVSLKRAPLRLAEMNSMWSKSNGLRCLCRISVRIFTFIMLGYVLRGWGLQMGEEEGQVQSKNVVNGLAKTAIVFRRNRFRQAIREYTPYKR